MSHSTPISRLSTQTLTTASSWRYLRLMDRRKFSSCLLIQPPCGIVKLLVCPNPSPLPLPPGHSTTKLSFPSIFIPFTQNAQCSKGSVTSGVREGGGCNSCYGNFPMARPWAGSVRNTETWGHFISLDSADGKHRGVMYMNNISN